MRRIFFDSGPIITLAMNDLLWVLEELQDGFDGKFLVTPKVKEEIVDHPMNNKKFKYEAMRVLNLFENGILEVHKASGLRDEVRHLMDLMNKTYFIKKEPMKAIQEAEVETIVAARKTDAEAIVVDERTMRMMIEAPSDLKDIFEKKLEKKLTVDDENAAEILRYTEGMTVLRSSELVLVAYERGLFKEYLPHHQQPPEELVDALLWAVKLRGCAISVSEIKKAVKAYGK